MYGRCLLLDFLLDFIRFISSGRMHMAIHHTNGTITLHIKPLNKSDSCPPKVITYRDITRTRQPLVKGERLMRSQRYRWTLRALQSDSNPEVIS